MIQALIFSILLGASAQSQVKRPTPAPKPSVQQTPAPAPSAKSNQINRQVFSARIQKKLFNVDVPVPVISNDINQAKIQAKKYCLDYTNAVSKELWTQLAPFNPQIDNTLYTEFCRIAGTIIDVQTNPRRLSNGLDRTRGRADLIAAEEALSQIILSGRNFPEINKKIEGLNQKVSELQLQVNKSQKDLQDLIRSSSSKSVLTTLGVPEQSLRFVESILIIASLILGIFAIVLKLN